ncbi:MAG: dihydroneopterin aldolase [Clostridia bacterium]|nr:dihydroneopterin aldolase [Clostridia bacterium]
MDVIKITGLKLFGFHGVNDYEKAEGQNFYADIELFCDLTEAKRSDSLDATVSYSEVIKLVKERFNDEKYDLIERAAEHLCAVVMESFPLVDTIRLTLHKPDAPVSAEFADISVTVEKTR